MKEKVILNRSNGEKEEKKVIAHFKVLDDSKPNIKNVPILILDKNEMNNGNNVLEFMWNKNGVYQSINDENAWSEVKGVVVDIIKNNALNMEYVDLDNVQADIGPGRSLGLTVAQIDPLTANFKTFVSKVLTPPVEPTKEVVNEPVKEEVLTESLAPATEINSAPAPDTIEPVVNETPVVDSPPVIDTPAIEPPVAIANEEVITPFASDAPAIESVINPAPVSEPVNVGPEIIETNKESDFDKMQQEIDLATKEYQDKIKSIIDAYKKKIATTIDEANSLKEQATESLKNAEAREQIATMAYQNSINNQAPSLELQKIA